MDFLAWLLGNSFADSLAKLAAAYVALKSGGAVVRIGRRWGA